MIGLFFEVHPIDGHAERYFELAAHLRPELQKNPGLVFIDRYVSIDRPHIVLSHSWWADEAALIAWREHAGHRAIQKAGRNHHFRDYRIRIGRLREKPDTVAGSRLIQATYLDDLNTRPNGGETFRSVYRDGKFLVLSNKVLQPAGHGEQRTFDIMRDYTMRERREAPQHYPPVERLPDND